MKGNSRSCFNFDAVVDWHERHKFLKFELPLDINNTYATYESQFGFVQRPTHKNTTLDAAKFEVCGHKFADLGGYGVASLSESKYGFACEGNVLRISLLRAATAPDAEQDQGRHEFSWAVMPHVGSFLEPDVPILPLFIYNSPLYVRIVPEQNASHIVPPLPFWLEGAPNIFLETIKREDGFELNASGTTVILRMYEAFGGHNSVKLHVGEHVPVKRAYVTNTLEDTKGELGLLSTTRDSLPTNNEHSLPRASFLCAARRSE